MWYDFPAVRTWLPGNWLLQVLLLKWTKFIMQSAYSSEIKQSLLKWNGCDCNVSMHDTVGIYCCHVTAFWNLIGTANFLPVEVTVWTRGSCQAVSPTQPRKELCMGRRHSDSTPSLVYGFKMLVTAVTVVLVWVIPPLDVWYNRVSSGHLTKS